ncbi:MAG: hypothetical protein JW881_18060 [Spirochaetales bacterium]|nr:hypothetical protein [Spirochaetales bacterium]
MKRTILCLLIFITLTSAVSLYAQDIDEDELFGDDMIEGEGTAAGAGGGGEEEPPAAGEEDRGLFEDDVVKDYKEEDLTSGIDTLLLRSDTVEIGGRFEFSLTPAVMWTDPALDAGYIIDNIADPDETTLTTTLESVLYFDARPEEDFRVYGKAVLSYPFTVDEDAGREMDDIIAIRELFADFNIGNTVFFRGGKHTIRWGVGYFFSPADILNLTPIDPADPTAEREGPVSLKAQYPFGVHNLYLYLIAHEIDKPNEIYVAPKAEFVIGTLEVGIGGIYQVDIAPTGMLTFTFPLFDTDMFAEAVGSYGANRTFVESTAVSLEHPFGLKTVERDNEFFFSGTAGFMYNLRQIDTSFENITFTGQYLFNGTGYGDLEVFENQAGLGALLAAGDITFRDLLQRGMHYAAVSVIWTEIFDSDITASFFWIGDLSDGSGQLLPQITWNVTDYAFVRLSIPVFYGGQYDEYTPAGPGAGAAIDFVLGRGSF